ncbi:hypothetical protein PG993_004284 [Apiospora rasikravindrae]|uniref:Uncharacterized protein n=1 Tax=Apiospora rasikravindrae TaxID=990691 RepID=A0ABR1TCC6_9PEZI
MTLGRSLPRQYGSLRLPVSANSRHAVHPVFLSNFNGRRAPGDALEMDDDDDADDVGGVFFSSESSSSSPLSSSTVSAIIISRRCSAATSSKRRCRYCCHTMLSQL